MQNNNNKNQSYLLQAKQRKKNDKHYLVFIGGNILKIFQDDKVKDNLTSTIVFFMVKLIFRQQMAALNHGYTV